MSPKQLSTLLMLGAALLALMMACGEAGPVKRSFSKRIFCNFAGCGSKRSNADYIPAEISLGDQSDEGESEAANIPYENLLSQNAFAQGFLRPEVDDEVAAARSLGGRWANQGAYPASAWTGLNMRRLAQLSALKAKLGASNSRLNKRSA